MIMTVKAEIHHILTNIMIKLEQKLNERLPQTSKHLLPFQAGHYL